MAVSSYLHAKAWEALVKSFGVIAVSEIGDKTFFIAAVMAMKNARLTVFAGALGALAAMTVLSAILGWAAPNLIPKIYTHYAAVILFFYFGFKTLYDVFFGDDHEGEVSELEQVEQELTEASKKQSGRKGDDKTRGPGIMAAIVGTIFSPVFLKAFTLTFLAEWGDRSQIATIGLAASQDVVGVIIGSVLGHALCTGAAVMGGRHLATHINERTVGIFGGILFILFGAHALYEGPH